MKIFPVLACALTLSSFAVAQTAAQKTAARSVFERFMTLNRTQKLNSPAARPLVTGEAVEYIKGSDLGSFSKPDAVIFPDATHMVTRVQALGEEATPVQDVYFYMTRSGSTWKVSALRSLAMTGVVSMALDELKRKPKLTPSERDEMATMKLTLALDADLRAHFQRNHAAFARLAVSERRPLSGAEKVKLRAQLHFDPEPTPSADGYEWIIGGMVDNTVGYGYSKSGELPAISANEIIWVERLSPNWYLFRTT